MTSARPDTWMPIYIGDYLADTMHLSTAEHGAYLLLIFAYWRSGKPLTDDDKVLAGICKVTAKQWRGLRPTLSRFFIVGSGEWRHKRIDAELVKWQSLKDKRSEAGAAGAAAKWSKSDPSHAKTRSERLSAARSKGTHTKDEWQALMEVFNYSCVRCGTGADDAHGGLCKDHITPIYQGGSDAISNLQPLCTSCNSSKGPDATDHRGNVYQDWQERLTKCLTKRLANASQMPALNLHHNLEEEKPDANASVKKKGQPHGTRIPDDWQPDEQDRQFARSHGLDPDAVAPGFRDYWIAKPGADGRKLDWPATWRNWCRRAAAGRAPGLGRMGHRQSPNSLIAAARAVAAQIEGEQ